MRRVTDGGRSRELSGAAIAMHYITFDLEGDLLAFAAAGLHTNENGHSRKQHIHFDICGKKMKAFSFLLHISRV